MQCADFLECGRDGGVCRDRIACIRRRTSSRSLRSQSFQRCHYERDARMNARGALVLGSALAALVVVMPLLWLLNTADSERAPASAEWIAHLRLALPAMIAVGLSAWWHSRENRAVDSEELTLSSRITWWSFPIFAMILIVIIGLEEAIFVERVAGLAGDLAMMSMVLFVGVMLASIVLFLPALFVEYIVVRLVRSNPVRTLLSGVDP